jgi:hypothetical protein
LTSVRRDSWEDEVIIKSDSAEYVYDSKDLLIEYIDMSLKETGWKIWGKKLISMIPKTII